MGDPVGLCCQHRYTHDTMLRMANGQASGTDTSIVVIRESVHIPTPIVDIQRGEYTDGQWREAVSAITDAEHEVLAAREVKRLADAAYEVALAARIRVQSVRDDMIATDTRCPAQVGRCAGVTRARCSIIRKGIIHEWRRRNVDPYGVVAALSDDITDGPGQ